jgi:hypothetical protein
MAPWIRIRFETKCWIRIHNPGDKSYQVSNRYRTNIRIVTCIVPQDEISMGFDRLVAMASEVDKRSKSAENSPAHNSPRKGEGDH